MSLGPDNRSRGYGTVLLATAEDAGRAVDMFNGYVWQSRTLEVRPDRMGLSGGVGMGMGVGGGMHVNGMGMMGGMNEYGAGLDAYGMGMGMLGMGSLGATSAGASGANTPFSNRLGSVSPILGNHDSGNLTPNLAAQLARVTSPNGGVSLNSPLLAPANGNGNGISLNSPRSVQAQLTGSVGGSVGGGERCRSLFVGNVSVFRVILS